MEINTKLTVLNHINRIYDDFANSLPDTACCRGCSVCCTRNVTLTTLEAYQIAEFMISAKRDDLFQRLETGSSKKRFQPRTTTNKLAMLCMQGKEPPEEENDPAYGPCPLLTDHECPIYPVRPFGCRCFVSLRNCRETGYADVEPFVISVNNVFLQYIEHIDAQGSSGNLTDMLLFMKSRDIRQSYQEGRLRGEYPNLISNHPIKVALVSPEHRDRVMPVIEALQNIKIQPE